MGSNPQAVAPAAVPALPAAAGVAGVAVGADFAESMLPEHVMTLGDGGGVDVAAAGWSAVGLHWSKDHGLVVGEHHHSPGYQGSPQRVLGFWGFWMTVALLGR